MLKSRLTKPATEKDLRPKARAERRLKNSTRIEDMMNTAPESVQSVFDRTLCWNPSQARSLPEN